MHDRRASTGHPFARLSQPRARRPAHAQYQILFLLSRRVGWQRAHGLLVFVDLRLGQEFVAAERTATAMLIAKVPFAAR